MPRPLVSNFVCPVHSTSFLQPSWNICCSKIKTHVVLYSGIKRCMALYFHMTTLDPMQLATPHSSSPIITSKFSLAFHVPRFKPSRTYSGWVGRTWSIQSERPCKRERAVPGTPVGVGGHPSASDSQPDPVHAWEMLDSYWFCRRTPPPPPPTDVRVTWSQNIE